MIVKVFHRYIWHKPMILNVNKKFILQVKFAFKLSHIGRNLGLLNFACVSRSGLDNGEKQ